LPSPVFLPRRARWFPGPRGGDRDRFLAVVTEAGGEVASVDRWGVRRFAYEINHKTEGYYFVTNFRAPPDTVPRLNQVLRIGDEYVRGKVLRPQ
jgi:small subunit ribosomal protein S6